MQKQVYNLFRVREWGETFWVLAAPGNSTFGRYSTATAARKDAKKYDLKVFRNEDLDSRKSWL